jgi:hypothetical protein
VSTASVGPPAARVLDFQHFTNGVGPSSVDTPYGVCLPTAGSGGNPWHIDVDLPLPKPGGQPGTAHSGVDPNLGSDPEYE